MGYDISPSINDQHLHSIANIMSANGEYTPTNQKYANTNLIGLIFRLDQLNSDDFGSHTYDPSKDLYYKDDDSKNNLDQVDSIIEEMELIYSNPKPCDAIFYVNALRHYIDARKNQLACLKASGDIKACDVKALKSF